MLDRQSRCDLQVHLQVVPGSVEDMKKAQGSEEHVGVVDGGVVEAKGKEERIVQTFKVSSKLWVCHPIHKSRPFYTVRVPTDGAFLLWYSGARRWRNFFLNHLFSGRSIFSFYGACGLLLFAYICSFCSACGCY